MARTTSRRLDVTPQLPTFQDVVNSVSEQEYRNAMQNPRKVQEDWDKFKVSQGSGRDLTMVSDYDPRSRVSNLKIAKNASHPSELVRATHEMGMNLQPAASSGLFEACSGCRTPQCTKACNAQSGKYGIKGGAPVRARQTRSAYWAADPANAGALMVMEARRGARLAREQGMIPAMRTNMWQDTDWTETTLAGPLIGDFEAKGSTDPDATGLAKDYPLMTHSNYTKKTMNRVLRPGEKEPEHSMPFTNYKLTGSISEQTPVERVRQRHAAGLTTQAVFWLKPTEAKPEKFVMQDKHGNRQEFDVYDADEHDARMHDVALGQGGKTGGLRVKQSEGVRSLKGSMDESGFIRPVHPDIPVGKPGGIWKEYASPDVMARQPQRTARKKK